MKYLHQILLAALTLIVTSCSSDDTTYEDSCRLLVVEPGVLYYEFLPLQDLGLGNMTAEFRGIEFEYDGSNSNKLVKVNGGLVPMPSGSNLIEYTMVNDLLYYDISYDGTVVTVNKIEEYATEPTPPNSYEIVNSQIKSRQVYQVLNQLVPELVDYTYEYDGNKIYEFIDGEHYRTFFIENGNLVKFERIRYWDENNPLEPTDIIHGKYEVVFSEYDELPNLLESKFFIDGAFFKAFSKNNYHKIELKYYLYDPVMQEFELSSNYTNWRSFELGLNPDGSNGMFKTECSDTVNN